MLAKNLKLKHLSCNSKLLRTKRGIEVWNLFERSSNLKMKMKKKEKLKTIPGRETDGRLDLPTERDPPPT
jgi:hypothetical protein